MNNLPPPTTFSKEDIIAATFNLYKEIGLEKITIRKIANKLGCSIQPIYSNFRNIHDLKKAVMEKAFELLLSYTGKHYSKNSFLNIGMGLLAFARDYKTLYRTMFINNNQYAFLIDNFFDKNIERMKVEESLKVLSEAELRRILEKTRLFTHGLATFICSGYMEDKQEDYITALMHEAGEDIIGYTLYRKQKK